MGEKESERERIEHLKITVGACRCLRGNDGDVYSELNRYEYFNSDGVVRVLEMVCAQAAIIHTPSGSVSSVSFECFHSATFSSSRRGGFKRLFK